MIHLFINIFFIIYFFAQGYVFPVFCVYYLLPFFPFFIDFAFISFYYSKIFIMSKSLLLCLKIYDLTQNSISPFLSLQIHINFFTIFMFHQFIYAFVWVYFTIATKQHSSSFPSSLLPIHNLSTPPSRTASTVNHPSVYYHSCHTLTRQTCAAP